MAGAVKAVVANDFKVLSVEENIRKYTPELSDNDIKGFVWYNRSLGIPMTGWEKWFIGGTVKSTVTAKDDIAYLNQQYEVVGKFQKGDEVGKVTKFENTYNGATFVAVRKFDNSLCLVDKSYLNIESDVYQALDSELEKLVKSKSLMYLNGAFMPLHVYSNTDYDTLRDQLEKDKSVIIEKFGSEVYDYHREIISGFSTMMINHPIKEKRFKLNPFGEIARETNYVTPEGSESSITQAFLDYTRTLKASDFLLVSKEVFYDRIQRGNNRVSKSQARTDDERQDLEEKGKREIADANLEAERLFSEFLNSIIDADTQKRLNKRINETYNKSILVNTSKVPVGFVCSNKFKNAAFALKPVQVEAFKFSVSRNNFCLALTVGFGKTSTAIAVLSYLIGSGTINKPLVIVPKPVLKNWQKELFGYWENGKTFSFTPIKGWSFMYGILTECGYDFVAINNLSQPYVKRAKEVKDKKKCIVLGSYEALQKMYIGSADLRSFVIDRWKDILEQSVEGHDESERQSAKKLTSLISKLNEVDKDASIDLLSLGLDSIYFDEAHRLKNLFSSVSADKTNRITSGFKGSPSDRSLRAFYITQYFQKQKGRVGFLTATPFSNTPLEVYTMLVFLNYSELVKNNVHKIVNFVELFFNETLEYKVNQKNKIVSESVMKNYKNKPILYKILTNTFIYKNDPKKANIQRPCIVRYPNKDMKLLLNQSPLQSLQRDALTGKAKDYDEFLATYPDIVPYFENFADQLTGLGNTKSTLGLAGRVMSASRSSAISPFAQSPLMLDFITDDPWREVYEYSPKIKFTIDSIKFISAFEKQKGYKQSSYLIYVGLGVNLLDHIKIALNNICGFKNGLSLVLDEDEDDGSSSSIYFDEVEIISGSADTDKEANRRERISDLFNKGLVKVIIGTDTIKEGLNLQSNCATLCILTPTWNSTDIQQIEGRIHRQGNRFGFARIITPLVSRTLDSFIYQKYEEKQSRINDIWQDDGLSVTESLDVDIKPEKQKELILDDAREIALIRAEVAQRQETNEYNKLKDEFDALTKSLKKSDQFRYFSGYFAERLPKIKEIAQLNQSNFSKILEYFKTAKDLKPSFKDKIERLKLLLEYYDELILTINHAITSNLTVDLINIFNGKFKRRQYYLNLYGWEQDDFLDICKTLQLSNPKNMLDRDIFIGAGISLNQKDPGDEYECIYDFSAIYSECFNAEKYILGPEGVSLSSSSEELAAVLYKFEKRVEDKITAIQSNFEVENNPYYGFRIKAKNEFVETLEISARLELDAENKLAKFGDRLAQYFTEKTNNQLGYALTDIDLDKCELPYEKEIDIEKMTVEAIKIDEIPQDLSRYKTLYQAIQTVIPDLDNLKTGYHERRGKMGDAIEPLSIEVQQLYKTINPLGKRGKKLIMEQNYVQNGDLMTDPRIDFAIYQTEQLAVPLNYEMNGMGIYQEFVEEGKIINLKNLKDVIVFCIDSWMPNLRITTPGASVEISHDYAEEIIDEKPTVVVDAKSDEALNTIGDQFFSQHPEKILGEFSVADYMNKIIVKGSREDVVAYFDKECPTCLIKHTPPSPTVPIKATSDEGATKVAKLQKTIKAFEILLKIAKSDEDRARFKGRIKAFNILLKLESRKG